MANLVLFAAVIGMLWLLQRNPKRRFIVGICYGLIVIAFLDKVDNVGAGVAYGSVAIVMWFSLQ